MAIENLVRGHAVHRAAYVDPEIYALEEERIFRRAWLYVGHESEIPAAGDYVLAPLGGEEVLLVRQEDGSVGALHNRCAHRGARIATCPGKGARTLRCPYHAWTYRLDGSLLGVPLPDGYADAPRAGLARVARVESYRGFIFATHDPGAPSLTEYLGGLASAFDNTVDRAPAGTLTRFGGRLQLEYRGNWKMFMENALDLVHPGFVHRSSVEAARAHPEALQADELAQQAAQMFLANGLPGPQWGEVPLHTFPGGHAYMGGFYRGGVIAPERADPVFARYRKALVERHGEEKTRAILEVDRFNNLVWPNLSLNARFAALRIVRPLAADRTVVEVQCFRLDGAPEEMHELTLRFVNLAASPASLVASDDLEIFERCQAGLRDRASDWIDMRRGVLADERAPDGACRSPGTSEAAVRNQFDAWKRYLCRS
ncbi:MAG TPA: aromatic ring-hydroxylating dioxygenase subunit alpha [Burkholderiales bacterium]|jgi:phenylpropionate dioxygenase-like ring-hydroxylating dioxygenase large terminal subunit|nr:aromatic ring-hydroxylating dioxygenase subunit alpha [Burkholderiales bacterium]